MSRVFWDTNVFIYLFEGSGKPAARAAELRDRILFRKDAFLTSTLTLGEVLVKPLETGNEELRRKYESVLFQETVLIPFTDEAAILYARIRRDRSLKAPDAIQLACAAMAGVDIFITNDERLSQKNIPGIQFIASLHRAFL